MNLHEDDALYEVLLPIGNILSTRPQNDISKIWGEDSGLARAREIIYSPLDPDIVQFRLLVLLPSPNENSILECELKEARINSCEPFEALSYVWGDPGFTASMKLNETPFLITPRLEEALRYLRRDDIPRVLWVDALCIDQGNNLERRYQVSLMRQIYSNCSSGIVWLGKDQKGALSRAMAVLTSIEGRDIQSLGYISRGEMYDLPEEPDATKRYELSWEDWHAIQKLLVTNEVWRRIWIMQEISLAPKVFLTCEKSRLDWDVIESTLKMGKHYTDAFHRVFGHGYLCKLTDKAFSTAQIIKTQRELARQQAESTGSSLLDVLARFRFTKATDPRDKVFAVLGLASDTLGITADYTRDTNEVYTDVAARIINHYGNLDIICQSRWQAFNNPKRRKGLPTWVPDFSWPGNGEFLFAQRAIFRAGRRKCASAPILVFGTISLNGFLISSLNLHNSTRNVVINNGDQMRYGTSESDWLTMLEWWTDGYVGDQQTYLTGEDAFQAFWRSVAGDRKRPQSERMQRLSKEEIAADDALIWRIKDGTQEPGDLCHMSCYMMIHEMIAGAWRFCVTDSNHFSMIPVGSVPGDVLVVLDGAKVPLVLRPVPGEGSTESVSFTVVGGAYVHGMMDGEAITGGFEERMFSIA